ncbi:hypothetical protein [Streptomyces sp. JHA26]|uniref:hypothetical protein n=1 Tax=Streptomyces sp. JHA26 TaxID=1917143 RepID=UPI00209AF2A2|nr:hypothetical protein [Streptomyces sp. JHA26]
MSGSRAHSTRAVRLVDLAELLGTELVSDAVRHTEGPAALRVWWSPPGALRIGAWDTDPEPPLPPRPFEAEAGQEDGRSPALVRAGSGLMRRLPAPVASVGSRRLAAWRKYP